MWLAPSLPRTLEAALRDLGETSAKVRASAVEDLIAYVDSPAREDVVLGLLRALSDEAPIVRAKAARGLGDARATSAVTKLLSAIDDEDALVRQLAMEALGEIADPRAVDRVKRALADRRPEVRFQAVMAYPKMAPDDAMGALTTATSDDDPGIRYVALRSIEELVQGSAAYFSLSPRAPLPEVLRLRAVTLLDDEAVEVRVAAALLLASVGDRSGQKILERVVEDRLTTPEKEDEAAAIEAVGALGARELIPALERRAYGPSRIFRDRCGFHAKVSLARLGVERARQEILADLGAWSREKRTVAVVAAGRALLEPARQRLEAMRDRPDRADPASVDEALASLARGAAP